MYSLFTSFTIPYYTLKTQNKLCSLCVFNSFTGKRAVKTGNKLPIYY